MVVEHSTFTVSSTTQHNSLLVVCWLKLRSLSEALTLPFIFIFYGQDSGQDGRSKQLCGALQLERGSKRATGMTFEGEIKKLNLARDVKL